VVEVGKAKRMLFRLRTCFGRLCIRAVFGVWSNKSWFCKWSTVYVSANHSNLTCWHAERCVFRKVPTECKSLVKADARNYFSKLCCVTVDGFGAGDVKTMYSCISRVLKAAKTKSSVQKFARVSDSNGHPAQSVSEENMCSGSTSVSC